jgi:hypothetical protein
MGTGFSRVIDSCFLKSRCGAMKGSIMDRHTNTIRSMRSVSSISCFEGVVVGVAVSESSSHLHAHALLWRWTRPAEAANAQATPGLAQA